MRLVTAWLSPLVVAAALTVAAWAWLGRSVEMPPAPEAKLHCASYTPFRGSQTPFDQTLMIPKAQIEEDLKQLQPVTGCVRTYAVNQGLDQVVPVAAALGMKVLLGIWIGREPADNEIQIKAAVQLAHDYPGTIRAIIVGNEVLLRGEQTGETLAALAKRVRQESGLPVTYADVWEYWWRAPPELKDSVDFITIHVLPYWEDQPLPVQAGVKHLEDIVARTREKFPGRDIMVGETGWPSAGRWREDAAPSIVNQARYLREFLVYAKEHDVDYNFIEAFDQPWKRWQEGTAGGFWGLFKEDRTPKFSWDQPVTEYPGWPLRAALSIVLGLGILLLSRFQKHAARVMPRYVASLGAMLAGSAMVLHFPHAWQVARNDWEWVLEILLGLQTLATAVLLIGVGLAGRLREAGGSLLEAIAWLRPPSRPRPPSPLQMLAIAAFGVSIGFVMAMVDIELPFLYRDFPTAIFVLPLLLFLVVARNISRWHWSGPLDIPPASSLPDVRQSIALLRLFALIGAATVSLGLCFDSRYRDFPLEAYFVPALFFAVADIARGAVSRAETDRREEAALALLLAGSAVFVFVNELPSNLESDVWCVLTLLLALPGIGAWRGLFQRLTMRSRAARTPTAASPAL